MSSLPTKIDRLWMFQLNQKKFDPSPGGNNFLVDGRPVPTTLENYRQVDFDTETWGVTKHKNEIKAGDLVIVRILPRREVGGVGLVRVTAIDRENNSMRVAPVEPWNERLSSAPIPDDELLDLLAIRPYGQPVMKVDPARWPLVRGRLEKLVKPRVDGRRIFDPSRRPEKPKPGDFVDPVAYADAMGKAVDGHHELLVALHARLVTLGVSYDEILEDRAGFDLMAGGTIFEVKTTTDNNHHQQVRLGLAQLLDYQLMSKAPVKLCLLIDRKLTDRQRDLLQLVDIGAIAYVAGTWSLEAGDSPWLRRLAGRPCESRARRLARLRENTEAPAPERHLPSLQISPDSRITLIETDLPLRTVQEFTFVLMQGWLESGQVNGTGDLIALAGENVPHHRRLSTWLALMDDVPAPFVNLAVSTARSLGGEVEVERSVVGGERRFIAPFARVTRNGLERLVPVD